ncbi:MAG: aspartate aminotransferase family protein [Hamadaea sp.]|uniref:aspartate aminotransferase family protein n=1 Tax=Hamadaea sp. TaxID=2024425 RepID=UPI001846851A|nr:aspartate aminotransferase family protein [Hamadaea sp.]NUR72079.1 aspartate aminotransferase family protein [Hamadaea sp.]NUT23115.1 aspartate aminotransferase family protein [Hamadaea sp.]
MTTDDLLARHRAVLPAWISPLYAEPIELVSGEGCRVTDASGRTYLDFFGGVLTTSIGYDVAEISDAVRTQIGTGVAHSSTLYLIRKQVELAEKIARVSGIPDAKVFLANSGTEANETALLLATQFRRSNQILAVRNSYHGRSFGALGVTGNRGWAASSLTPVNVSYLHSGDRLRGVFAGLSDADYIARAVEDLREVLATTTSGDVACLIAEPIQGVGGFVAPPDGLFGAFKEVLDEYGILWVSDEVQTGWGRTGAHFWGYQAHDAVPDMLTFAKGIGNGYALGGVVARAEVMDCLTATSFNTFGGNPISSAAGAAVLDFILDHDLQGNCARVGDVLHRGLRDIAATSPIVADVRGRGLMLAVEFVEAGSLTPSPGAALRVVEECKAAGLLVGKGGLYGNVIRMGPPMTLTEAEAKEGLGILAHAVETVGAAQ